jgi:lambda repressor-like predicted transcriptional regulator
MKTIDHPHYSVARLAREAGLNQHTLASKLRRKTRFSDVEAKAIRRALGVSA